MFHLREATSIKLENSTKNPKLLTTSEHIISLFFHLSVGRYTWASTYAKMYIFMSMCFIKEDESCHLHPVNLFCYFRCSETYSVLSITEKKLVLHTFWFLVIGHHLSSNGKNYIHKKVITRTHLCILTAFTMNIFEDRIFFSMPGGV